MIPLFGIFEEAFESARGCDRPLTDVSVRVIVTAPDGRTCERDAFWDGGRTWRFRFRPETPGKYRWNTVCNTAADEGLHGQSGEFVCEAPDPALPGPVRLAEDHRSFVRANGEPWFWLADTAWNGVLRSTDEQWQRYLDTRQRQRFTAVQFVAGPWRGCSRPEIGQPWRLEEGHLVVDPDVFAKIDRKLAAVNEHGLVAAPVMLWAFDADDPGQNFSEEDALTLCRYLLARWGACDVVWLLGGDGNYTGQAARRWQDLGQEVFADRPEQIVTLHPQGLHWYFEDYRDQPWLSFVSIQSGHGGADTDLNWLTTGPWATDWPGIERPMVNLEPNYEGAKDYHSDLVYDAYHVRRAAYWSLMTVPTAGITYGNNAIRIWPPKHAEQAEGHAESWRAEPWHTGLESEGITSMTVLRDILDRLPWPQLHPAPARLAFQPGREDPNRFIACAASADGECVVAYSPAGDAVTLTPDALAPHAKCQWVDPRDGHTQPAEPSATNTFPPPDSDADRDWLLVARGEG